MIGPPGQQAVDPLALIWAHEIAWATHGHGNLDELEQLGHTARRYHVSMQAVLDERRRQKEDLPVVPAPGFRPAGPPPSVTPADRAAIAESAGRAKAEREHRTRAIDRRPDKAS